MRHTRKKIRRHPLIAKLNASTIKLGRGVSVRISRD